MLRSAVTLLWCGIVALKQVWNTHNWTCHKDLVLGQGDEIWALAVVGDRLVSGSIDRYCCTRIIETVWLSACLHLTRTYVLVRNLRP